MELINRQDAIKALRDTFLGDTYEIDVVACGTIESLPTVNAIPVSFIRKRIEFLHELGEYEFETNGAYGIESACEYELKKILEEWEKTK